MIIENTLEYKGLKEVADRRLKLLRELYKYVEDEMKTFVCPSCDSPRWALPHADDCELVREIGPYPPPPPKADV